MRDSERETFLIDHYLRGELTNDQKTEFYQLLQLGGSIKEEFELKKSIQNHFSKASHDKKLQILKNIEQEEFSNLTDSNENKNLKIRRRRMIVFAATAAAIALVISIFNPTSTSDNMKEHMLSNQFEAYPSSTIKRGAQDSDNEIKIDAYLMYEMGNYTKAAPLLENLAIKGDSEAYLFAGIAYLGNSEYSKSIELLNKYKLTIKTHLEVPDLYIAISQFMLGKTTESITKLEELSLRSDFIGTQAKNYLKEIQK